MSGAIEIIVDNRIRLRVDDLSNRSLESLQNDFIYSNPLYYRAKELGFYPTEPPTIKTWDYEQDKNSESWLTLPRGGMGRIQEILRNENMHGCISDRRSTGEMDGVAGSSVLFPELKMNLWDHQERTVEGILAEENCIIRSPTGSGKTTTLIAAVVRVQLPSLVVVCDTGLLKQWRERIEKELGIRDIGIIRGKTCRLRPITLAMQQTLNKYSSEKWAHIGRAFGFVGCDEVHRFAASTFLKTVDRFAAKYRVGVSDDETRKDRKEFLLYDLFGGVAAEIPKGELVTKGIIHDVALYVVPTDSEASSYQEARDSGETPNFNELLDALTADQARNELVMKIAAGCLKRGLQLLVFSQRKAHCRLLDMMFAERGYRTGLLLGGAGYEQQFDATRAGIQQETIQVGVGTFGRIGMGLDLPAVSCGIVTTPIRNNRQFMSQVSGRICRTSKGKEVARLYYLWDRRIYGPGNLKQLRKWNNTVRVWTGSDWLDIKDYLREHNEKTRTDKTTDGIFINAEEYRESIHGR